MLLITTLAIQPRIAIASPTDGTIDSAARYAWSENFGWLDFGTTAGNVHITDTELTGYAWSENAGWVSLNCSNTASCATVDYKISNNSLGQLSGYAWSENTGWILFSPTGGGVTISSSGEFSGYAWGENTGWIVLNCATTASCSSVDYKITTDWRPASARSAGGGTNPTTIGLIGINNFAITINNGATSTASPAVTVNLTGGENTATVVISNTPTFLTENRFQYNTALASTNVPFTLSAEPGKKTLYAKFCTSWGLCSGTFSAEITLNATSTPPPLLPPSPPPAASVFDLNADGRVDVIEFNQLLVNWGPQTNDNPSDYNHDHVIDIFDFNLLMVNWSI